MEEARIEEAWEQAAQKAKAEAEQKKEALDKPIDGKITPDAPTKTKERIAKLLSTDSPVETVRVEDIHVDPETYQFKGDVNEQGVTKPLTGNYKPGLSQPLILHRRLDGTLYVADGHHRLDLAKRNNIENVSAVILEESDGYTPADVRVYAAIRNLSQGRGTSIDAAKLFRDAGFTAEELAYYGLSTNETIVEQGMKIASLPDDAFNRVVNGEIPVYTGALMGEMFPDDIARQNTFLKEIHGKNLTQAEQRVVAEDVKEAEEIARPDKQFSFFDDTSWGTLDTNLAERAQIINGLKNRMTKEAGQFETLSKKKTVDKVGNVGQNTLDADANKAHSQTIRNALWLLETRSLKGDVNRQVRETLNKYATELATNPKMSKTKAVNAAYTEIMEIAKGGMQNEVRGQNEGNDDIRNRSGLEGQGRTGEVSSDLAGRGTGSVLEGGRGTTEAAPGGQNLTPQYSIQFGDDKRLNALINYARDNVQPELLEMALGKKLNALFEKQNTRTSFQQANPVRIAKELAANLGTKIYTADIKSDAVLGYYQQRVQNIVVDKDSISDFSVSLFGIGQYVYGSAKLDNVFTQMTQNEFLREFADYMTHSDESVDPMFVARLS